MDSFAQSVVYFLPASAASKLFRAFLLYWLIKLLSQHLAAWQAQMEARKCLLNEERKGPVSIDLGSVNEGFRVHRSLWKGI